VHNARPRGAPHSYLSAEAWTTGIKLGRTKVICSAADTSGNMARAQFAITVKRS
jgi:hypothetical protein